MTKKELKILCGILAAGQAGWIYAWWTAHRTIAIKDRTIAVLDKHVEMEEKFASYWHSIVQDALKMLPPEKADELRESIDFQEIAHLSDIPDPE